jgi:hypothetical protein
MMLDEASQLTEAYSEAWHYGKADPAPIYCGVVMGGHAMSQASLVRVTARAENKKLHAERPLPRSPVDKASMPTLPPELVMPLELQRCGL